jgi:hypothetical protein
MQSERRRLRALQQQQARLAGTEPPDGVGRSLDALRADITSAQRGLDEVIAAAHERSRRIDEMHKE